MRINLQIQRKLFLSHFLAVLLVSGSIGTYFYLSAEKSLIMNLQDRLKYSAAMVSQAVEAKNLEDIRGKDDVNRPEYQYYLDLLRAFRRTNPDIAYLYLMRKSGDKVFFVIDTDETDRQAMPGDEYQHQIPSLMEGFLKSSVDKKIYTDEWGAFMSGYSPVRHSEGKYLIGIDMRATEVENKLHKLRISGIISLLFSVLLALIFSRFLSRHFNTPIQLLVSRCDSIAKGKPGEKIEVRTGDELDNLISSYNDMSMNLQESKEKNMQAEDALRKANENLEMRVEERTKELVELTRKLVDEISERKQAEERLARTATSDLLTGVMNRRAMLEQLRYQLVRHQRNKTPFILLVLDIDHFKNINDTYGHDIGDQALISVADVLLNSTRSQDLISRWGGEEFLILLPDTDIKGGVIVAEKIRSRVESEVFKAAGKSLQLTMSIGVTEYKDGQNIEQCIKAADSALYKAKDQGRNRVVVFENTL
jgi:diguanylate cyclase (GGDEF)-like protein